MPLPAPGREYGGALPPLLGYEAKPQKLCKFHVMKLQNNKEFHTETVTKCYAFQSCNLCMHTYAAAAKGLTFV